jgi:hypothetical protein
VRVRVGGGSAALGLLAVAATFAAADPAHAAPLTGPCSFRLSLLALTDQQSAQLSVAVVPRTGSVCGPPQTLRKVTVRTRAGTTLLTQRLVPAPRGHAVLELGPVHSRTSLQVRVVVAAAGKTRLLTGGPTVRLRPDLVVAGFRAPPGAAAGSPFVVSALIAEPTGGVPARAQVVLTSSTTTIATVPILARPARRVRVSIPVTLTAVGSHQLTLSIVGVAPAETNADNDTAQATLEVSELYLDRADVLVPALAGYGVQFNQNVYAAISRNAGVTDANVGDMEQKVVALGPQLARIFFHPNALKDPDLMQSFVRTVQLAQRAGATINVTWQGGALTDAAMASFGGVLAGLVKSQSITRLRWVTVQNEVNSTRITMEQYEHAYRVLDANLTAAGVRTQVRFMGGDLVGSKSPLGQTQADWLGFLATKMADLLDAFSIHAYWNYFDTGRLVQRLQDVKTIWNALPAAGRKPIYVTEYGVRGRRSLNGVNYPDPGVWDDTTPIEQTDVNAFQHAWFDVLAARLGYAGTIKWDGYFGRYDKGIQDYSLIGPPQQGWPLRPIYSLLRLFIATTQPGWQVVSLDGSSGTKLLAGYAGASGQETVIGLDTSGASLNAVSATQVSYQIGGLPPNATLQLLVWNQDGSGALSPAVAVQTDTAGVATVTVPQQAVFALTTLPSAA